VCLSLPALPAAASALREKDIITAVEGTGIDSMDELKAQLAYYAGGTTIELTIQRVDDGEYKEQIIEVTLGYKKDYEESRNTQKNERENGGFSIPGLN